MKKLTALFLSFILVLGLAACGNNNTNNTEPSTTETPSAATSEPETTELHR